MLDCVAPFFQFPFLKVVMALNKLKVLVLSMQDCTQKDEEQSLVMRPGLTAINFRSGG